jgi:hypothetical protein
MDKPPSDLSDDHSGSFNAEGSVAFCSLLVSLAARIHRTKGGDYLVACMVESSGFILIALPLFILMGEFMGTTGGNRYV